MNRYTLSGSVYRQKFIRIMEKMIKVLLGNTVITNNKIMPKP